MLHTTKLDYSPLLGSWSSFSALKAQYEQFQSQPQLGLAFLERERNQVNSSKEIRKLSFSVKHFSFFHGPILLFKQSRSLAVSR